jgi:hypothetical protein
MQLPLSGYKYAQIVENVGNNLPDYMASHPRRQFLFSLCGGTLGTAATTGLLYQPRMIGDGDCGEIGGLKLHTKTSPGLPAWRRIRIPPP